MQSETWLWIEKIEHIFLKINFFEYEENWMCALILKYKDNSQEKLINFDNCPIFDNPPNKLFLKICIKNPLGKFNHFCITIEL